MGYYVTTMDQNIFIDKKYFGDIYNKMCKLNDYDELKRGGSSKDGEPYEGRYNPNKWFAWMDYNYPETCNNLQEILQQIGFEITYDDEGNITGLFYDNKTGSEDYFLQCFAGYVPFGSFIEFKGEDDAYYKYVYGPTSMHLYSGHLRVDYDDTPEETYEFGKMSKSDVAIAIWREQWKKEQAEKSEA